MHHFFVTPADVDTELGVLTLAGEDVNHIKNVLRMKPGEEMLVSDGCGNDYVCELDSLSVDRVTARIVNRQFEGTELPAKIYLFQGLPKSDKMEWIIQKAVELGVYRIIPVATKRSVVKLDEKKEQAKRRRWNEIARSAAGQSRRSIIPEVERVHTFAQALEYMDSLELKMIPYENFKDMSQTIKVIEKLRKETSIGILIGPEGGFADEEVEQAICHQVEPISLGKRILRTETAGMMLVSVLMFELEKQVTIHN